MDVPGLGKPIDNEQAAEPFCMLGHVAADLRNPIPRVGDGDGHCPGEALVDTHADRRRPVQHRVREQLGEDLDYVKRCIGWETPQATCNGSDRTARFGKDGDTTTGVCGEISRCPFEGQYAS
jgi:hypothetical protein